VVAKSFVMDYICSIERIEDERFGQVCPSMRGETGMTKTDLVARIAKDASLTKGQAEKALQAMIASVEEALRHGERVTLVGFGTFAVRARAARSGRNPRTGQPLLVPARKTPTFSVGKRLRQVVN
jgi:DNA-binding protein HU-beta